MVPTQDLWTLIVLCIKIKIDFYEDFYEDFSKDKKMFELSNYAAKSKYYKGSNKLYSKKTNPKITILEILVYKIQPEIIKSKIFTRFNSMTKPCSQESNYQQYVQIKTS